MPESRRRRTLSCTKLNSCAPLDFKLWQSVAWQPKIVFADHHTIPALTKNAFKQWLPASAVRPDGVLRCWIALVTPGRQGTWYHELTPTEHSCSVMYIPLFLFSLSFSVSPQKLCFQCQTFAKPYQQAHFKAFDKFY